MQNKSLTLLLAAIVLGLTACSDSGSKTPAITTPSSGNGTLTNTTQYPLFRVRGHLAYMNGEIKSDIGTQLDAMLAAHPQVDTIVLEEVPGSSDDEANLAAARKVHQKGLKTMILSGGEVASGGVDFFLAGKERSIADGALIGVHSWAGDGINNAATLPKGASEHDLYEDFYKEISIDPDFYWFTIQAADAENIHWMRSSEVNLYGISTRKPTESERLNVIPVPTTFESAITDTFDRYTWVDAPNGKPVHIFAQQGVRLSQIIKARSVMQFYLTNYGALDKKAVANKMADDNASLFIFRTEAESEAAFNGTLGDSKLAEHGQDLYATEIFVEGDNNYITNPEDSRDATYEEVLHLVQGYGLAPTNQALQQRIAKRADEALMDKVWNPEADQVAEWRAEGDSVRGNSVSYEYFASIVEAYFGLWQHLPEGMDGYTAPSRTLQTTIDPVGIAIIQDFLPDNVYQPMMIDSAFPAGQTFEMQYQSSKAYTFKSQYLVDAHLSGNLNSNIKGNDHNNVITGNKGNNELDGGEGKDSVVVFGLRDEFQLTNSSSGWELKDLVSNRNGTDILKNIEAIEFRDQVVNL